MAQNIKHLLRGTAHSDDPTKDFLAQAKDDGDNTVKKDNTNAVGTKPVPERRSTTHPERDRAEAEKRKVIPKEHTFLGKAAKMDDGSTVKKENGKVIIEKRDGTKEEYYLSDNGQAQKEKPTKNLLAERMKGN